MKRVLLLAASLIGLAGLAALALAPPGISPEAIRTSVDRTPSLIATAWRLPVAAAFRPSFRWQPNPSLCGPTSVANTLRSLGEAGASEAKVLSGTGLCRTGYCFLGLTLDELADVARAKTGRNVTVLRDLTLDAFRAHLRRASEPGRRYIVNFSRAPIFGTGVGHHSPIGGYLEAEDLVFVLDVNRQIPAMAGENRAAVLGHRHL